MNERYETFGKVYEVFFEPGEVTEIRAYGLSRNNKAWEGWAGGSGVVYGYFDNPEAFGQAAEGLERARAPGIYFTLNPCKPDLLARAANRLKAASGKAPLTSDLDIRCIRWLPIDVDWMPVDGGPRPAGISSTDEEMARAIRLRNRISKWMEEEMGAQGGILGNSGNGGHLLYRLPDMPNSRENVEWLKGALKGLSAKFTGKFGEVDERIFNPSRILKLYGSTVRKGDHTKERPHRVSYVEKIDE